MAHYTVEFVFAEHSCEEPTNTPPTRLKIVESLSQQQQISLNFKCTAWAYWRVVQTGPEFGDKQKWPKKCSYKHIINGSGLKWISCNELHLNWNCIIRFWSFQMNSTRNSGNDDDDDDDDTKTSLPWNPLIFDAVEWVIYESYVWVEKCKVQTFEFQIRARMPTTDIACTYTLSPFYFIFHSLSMQSLPIHMHMALAIIICIVRRMDRLYVADAITRFVHCSCSHVCCKLNGNQKFYTQAPIYTHTQVFFISFAPRKLQWFIIWCSTGTNNYNNNKTLHYTLFFDMQFSHYPFGVCVCVSSTPNGGNDINHLMWYNINTEAIKNKRNMVGGRSITITRNFPRIESFHWSQSVVMFLYFLLLLLRLTLTVVLSRSFNLIRFFRQ